MKKIRLDKFLANAGYGSRKEVKGIIKVGRLTVDGKIVNDASSAIDPTMEKVSLDGKLLDYNGLSIS